MDKQAGLKAFTDPEDKLLFAKAFDRYEACRYKGLPAFTDFMDPQRGEKISRLFEREKITVRAFGGYEDAERRMIGFSADDALADTDFPITALAVTFNAKFSKAPGHRDYLGSVLGLGLERTKIGDIRLADGGAVLYVASEMEGYITAGLERVGNTAVAVKVMCAADGELPGLRQNGASLRITVASLRLDAVIGGAFKLSRSKAQALIESEKVFVNWTLAAAASKQLADGDVVTARGLGRIKVEETQGKTKKDRIVLSITRY